MHSRIRLLLPLLALVSLALLMSGCDPFSSPQNTFAPEGQPAKDQKFYFLFVMWPALVIMIGVLAACVVIPIMYRRKKNDPGLPKQIHGHTALELSWTILPALLLAVTAVPTIAGIQDLGRDPSDEALRVHVTGQRFSWLFDYPDIDAGGAPLSTNPNELRIPVGREIGLTIDSIDVNHSFWVPKLAGKIDAINNHTNVMWLRADNPGTYAGQCAEFCGLQHSDMRFRVIAMPVEEFNAWVQEQGGVEGEPGSGEPQEEDTGAGDDPEGAEGAEDAGDEADTDDGGGDDVGAEPTAAAADDDQPAGGDQDAGGTDSPQTEDGGGTDSGAGVGDGGAE